MADLYTLCKVTITDVDRHYAGSAHIPRDELMQLIGTINSDARIVRLDKRWGANESYLPVHRIAKIEVEDICEGGGS